MPTLLTSPIAANSAQLTTPQFKLFRELILKETGISIAENKLDFVQSRLKSRLRALNIASFSDYFELLTSKRVGGEMQEMINRITTNKTHFFREQHHFDYLNEVVFPQIIDEAQQGKREKKLRIWCAAASTGEEPYSLAISTHDAFSRQRGWDIRILASDIDTKVLAKAEQAEYPLEALDELPRDIVQKHFVDSGNTEEQLVRMQPKVAELVAFRQVNLLGDVWPIRTQFDIIFCRNVLIYFDDETQKTLMTRMSKYLKPDGSLFIGHSESLSSIANVYTRVGKTVYRHAGSSVEAPLKYMSKLPQGGSKAASGEGGLKPRLTSGQATTASVGTPPKAVRKRKRIVVGDIFASSKPAEVSTVLGSCVAVCLWDRKLRIGGMNHFALADGNPMSRNAASIGIHAMELLINEIMKLGGGRRRLQAKVFGAGRVLDEGDPNGVGARNEKFIREFLETEKIPITAEYLGSDRGIQVIFEPHTGKVRVKLLEQADAISADQEVAVVNEIKAAEPVSDITLF
ncbi:MAG: CheR family methyltransferase [Pirellulaceae bacterium]